MKGALLFLMVTALLSCDPLRRIVITNKTGADAAVVWTLKEDSAGKSPLFINSATEVKFELKKDAREKEINLSAGMGTWTSDALNNFCDDLEKLEIKTAGNNQTFKGSKEIRDFLWALRKGIGKRVIKISLE